jgi:3-hydroxymyristoyl/3-hydroxydecanoyl-(acyl carrier protein) dehydratase
MPELPGFRVPHAHPAFAGHFPGAPILPGVVLLDETLRRIADTCGCEWLHCRVQSAKFLRVVRPGDELRVEFEQQGDGSIRFAVRCNALPVASGHLLPPYTDHGPQGMGGAEPP